MIAGYVSVVFVSYVGFEFDVGLLNDSTFGVDKIYSCGACFRHICKLFWFSLIRNAAWFCMAEEPFCLMVLQLFYLTYFMCPSN